MRGMNQENWIENIRHHLKQFSKGMLVSIFTFASYGLAKRLLGDASETPAVDSHSHEITLLSQKSSAEIAREISQSNVSPNLPNKPPAPTTNLKSMNSKILRDAHKQRETSVADELGISFHEKTPNPTVITHTINPENPDPEDTTIIIGEEFRVQIPGYLVSDDGKTYYFGNMTATLADGSPLPKWMHFEPPPKPFAPEVIGTVRTATIYGIALQKDLALLAADINGLQIVNISDPRHPKLIGSQALPDAARGITVQNDIALMAGNYAGLQLVNISDPQHPRLISSLVLPGPALSIAAERDLALIAAGGAGLHLANVSDPHYPRLIRSQALPGGPALSVTVQRDVALVAYYG